MEDRKKLALLIVNHLKSQLDSSGFSEESSESMEVAIQCIESAYSLNSTDSTNVSVKLENIVKQYYQKHDEIKQNKKPEISQDIMVEAEYHKNCGNEFMKVQNNEKAIEAYTKSISLNPNNPIFYCNRAAAFNAIGKYNNAIEDCQKAIELDSTYSKAYCRLGLAFSYLKDYERAASCYKQACDLEPNNVGYQNNYQLTLNHLQNPAGLSNMNPNTPHFMATAARLMSNPEVSSVITNILGEVTGSAHGGVDRLMQVGHTIVTRLQTTNPDILDGLRIQFENSQNEGQQPPNGLSNDNDHQN